MIQLVLLAQLALGAATPDSARIIDARLMIEPLGVSMMFPAEWLPGVPKPGRIRTCLDLPGVKPELVTSREELERLRNPAKGYDVEFADLLDTVLPFDRMIAHLGADQWGSGRCWNGLRVRVYVLPGGPDSLLAAVNDAEIPTPSGVRRPTVVATTDSSGWTSLELRWYSPHGDLIGSGQTEIRYRQVRGRTLVLAFMYMGTLAELQRNFIRSSVEGVESPP